MWYWLVPPVILLALALLEPKKRNSVLLPAAIGLVWVAAFLVTDDRRLYFPYTLHFAVLAGDSTRPRFSTGALLVIAAFTAIRWLAQSASDSVLAVELVAAAVALWVAQRYSKEAGWGPVKSACLASIIALASLVL